MARPKDAHLLHLQQTEPNPFSRPATPGHHAVQIGFCGLGAMGYPMARNMAKWRKEHVQGGLPVVVWNRTKVKGDALAKELGQDIISVAASLEEVVSECDIIFTNLSNDEVVLSVYQTFVKTLEDGKQAKGRIFVETSTIYPTVAAKLDVLLSSIPSTTFVSSPVFGPPATAEVAQLLIVMSGDYRSKKEVAHIMYPSVGRKVIDLGGNIEKASTFKLIGNSMILGSLELIAESFALGEKAGIGAPMTYSLMKELIPAPLFTAYGDKMLHDKFDGTKGFAIDGGIKDSQHIRRLTTELNSPMPSLDAAHQHLLTARALHQAQIQRGDAHFDVLDWSSLIAGARVASGLDAFDSSKHGKVVPEKEE
ncbi:NAD(P)-binding protein [Epithele typhae]|uniref:NAD(P)-binding protein n=1 Tax=Epithele typhae TaxID=378194 RepID=UPI002007E8DF|nr:NAD(P)-binding protein [Epithele typhae]KAH9932081.1 NAD(P)-binding protein [Epithele typhae]